MRLLKMSLCAMALMFTAGVVTTGCGDKCASKCDEMLKKHYKGDDADGYVKKCVKMCKEATSK